MQLRNKEKMFMRRLVQCFCSAVLVALPFLTAANARAAAPTPSPTTNHRTAHRRSAHVQESASAKKHITHLQHTRRLAATTTTIASTTHRYAHLRRASLTIHRRSYERFNASSFTDQDLTQGDVTAGEDPVVRQAAIAALGNMYGTVLAIDPSNGRILAMVNQKLALSSGAEPCSTIKISVALAALSEGIITKDTPVNLGGSYHLNLTDALAHSNNLYFETLGRSLGFERVRHYANQFGLGELAGYNIPGEQLGVYPDQPLPADRGGVGRMCSFGESVSMTPLQLGALVSAVANGGTLYYLQHPTTADQAVNFQPRIKRTLDIRNLIPEIQDGMQAAVEYGTARSLKANFNQFPVMGKTGTCSNNGTRFGWFASYADTQYGRIVTVIFLEGGRPTFGPKAAELTGYFYKNLWDHSYFAQRQPAEQPQAVKAGETAPVAATGVNQ
jgi:penicillin-binding protein 2